MTAEERYEWAWKRYLVRLNKNSKIRLATFLREVHVYQQGMERWMYAKGLSVMETKRLIREVSKPGEIRTAASIFRHHRFDVPAGNGRRCGWFC